MHVDNENGQPARTRYRVIDRVGNRAAWVELQPLTGRTHQLRVHLAAIGHPIVGDGKYGGQEAFLTGSISRKMHLHARRLIIDAPGGGTIDATAELPEHFAASMEQLGFDPAASDGRAREGPAAAVARGEEAGRQGPRQDNTARPAAASGAAAERRRRRSASDRPPRRVRLRRHAQRRPGGDLRGDGRRLRRGRPRRARPAPGAPHRRTEPAERDRPARAGASPEIAGERASRPTSRRSAAPASTARSTNRCSTASPRCSRGCTAPAGRSASPPASPTAGSRLPAPPRRLRPVRHAADRRPPPLEAAPGDARERRWPRPARGPPTR